MMSTSIIMNFCLSLLHRFVMPKVGQSDPSEGGSACVIGRKANDPANTHDEPLQSFDQSCANAVVVTTPDLCHR